MAKTTLKPKIRFKGFTDDWEQCKLLEVANYRNGKAHENEIDENGKYIVVNSKFVSTEGKVRKFSNKQNEPLLKNEIAFVLSDVPNGKAIAKTFLVDKSDKYTLNQRIAGITPFEYINPKYLSITMNRNKYFLQFDDGVKQTNLSLSDMLKYENYYPIKEEQDKIGLLFTKLDNLITLHQRKCEKLKNVKKSLLEKMFPKSNEIIPEIRFKGFTDAWEQRKCKDISDFFKGNGYSKSDLTDIGMPIILYGRLYTQYQFSINKVDTFTLKKENSVISKGNEVIIPASGETAEDIARASAVENTGVILGGDLNILRPYNFINKKFLALTISNGTTKKELSSKAQGKSIVHIHNSDIQDMNIKYPIYNEQEKIGELFSSIDNLTTLHQRDLEKLKEMKKTLLNKMFV